MLQMNDTAEKEFEDIRKTNDVCIVDSSVCAPTNSEWYRKIYDAHSFRKVEESDLIGGIDSLGIVLAFLRNPDVFSVDGVVLELERTKEMIKDKMDYLIKIREVARRKEHGNGAGSYSIGENRFREIHNLFHECYFEIRRSRFKPIDKLRYGLIEDVVMDVVQHTDSKRDYSYLYSKTQSRAKPKNMEDFHADEQIIAAALYLSSVENRSVGIVTRDSDLRRIIVNSLNDPRFLGIRDLVRENRVRIYFNRALGKGYCVFDSFDGHDLKRT